MGISVGLVGLGAFGKEFADLFMRHPLVDRVGLCDREADRIQKFAERYSARARDQVYLSFANDHGLRAIDH